MLRFRCEQPPELQPALAGMPAWMSALLSARGIQSEEEANRFLSPSLDDLHEPLLMHDMAKAVDLIHQAIQRQEPVIVYGDYDVDGVCASAIMLETLKELGAKVSVRIPSRHTDGYGLHEDAVHEIASAARLLITVDCGISSAAEVDLARQLGLRVIVTDHHELPDTLPPADAVLNPLLADYPYRHLCGAGVALKVTQALQNMDGVRRRLDLAALATVADVVPLTGENRVIVREGLACMFRTGRPGLVSLIRQAGLSAPLRSEDLAFRLGPRLNAAGRLEDALQAVQLLTSGDEREADRLARHLEELNRNRQQEEKTIIAQALRQLGDHFSFRENRIIILAGENWNKGLIGLAAGKICERFHYPVIILSIEGETATGSCRSIPGVNIFEMLSCCSDLLLRFGGHAQAAGLSLETRLIPELQRRLSQAIRDSCDDSVFLPVQTYDLELPFRELTLENLTWLDQLEPTGYGNPPAVFLASAAEALELRRVGQDRSHLRVVLRDKAGDVLSGIGFSMGEEADHPHHCIDVLFQPSRNEFRGQVSVQLMLRALRPSPDHLQPPDDASLFLSRLQEISSYPAKKEQLSSFSSVSFTEAMESLKQPLGVLVLTWDRERALQFAESGADLAFGEISAPQGYSTILCGWKADRLRDQWSTVLLDSRPFITAEWELIQAHCPHADLKLVESPESPDVFLQELNLPVDTLRFLYRLLRSQAFASLDALSGASGLSRNQAVTALQILAEARLVSWQTVPFRYRLLPPPPEKQDITRVPLYRFLRETK